MYRPLNWFVVLFAILVLGANLLLVKPHPDALTPAAAAEPAPAAAPVVRAAPPGRAAPVSPFAYIHEDGREEYLPAGASFESEHAAGGFPSGQPFDSRAAVYSWSSSDPDAPISASRTWQ